MSVGIGPMLTLEVAEGSWLSAAWYKVSGFFPRHAPWSYFGSIVVALAVLAMVLTLRSRRAGRVGQGSRRRPRGSTGRAVSEGTR
jgi:hypothetical protein